MEQISRGLSIERQESSRLCALPTDEGANAKSALCTVDCTGGTLYLIRIRCATSSVGRRQNEPVPPAPCALGPRACGVLRPPGAAARDLEPGSRALGVQIYRRWATVYGVRSTMYNATALLASIGLYTNSTVHSHRCTDVTCMYRLFYDSLFRLVYLAPPAPH